jgi:hypothetical protein
MFWGECGALAREKLHRLLRRYSRTHFAVLEPQSFFSEWAAFLQEELVRLDRPGPVELFGLPEDLGSLVEEDGTVDPTAGTLVHRSWSRDGRQ